MTTKRAHAKYGADAVDGTSASLPSPFPRTMGPNCTTYLQEVVDSGLTSDMVGRFEYAFAEAMGVRHCIATPGCTPALAILAAAFDFDPGDEIIVSAITDYGTMQGLLSEHYIPAFADTIPGSVNVSADTIAPCITDRTRAILVVHLTGIVCDMDPILRLADQHNLVVYEDACQAVFSEYKGRYAGSMGVAGGFSFDSEKTMGSDVGGCVVTDDDELADRLRFVGQSRGGEMRPHFGREHTVLGYAHRMTQSTAAISLAQLEILRPQVAQRDRMIREITRLLSEIPGITPLPIPDYQDVYSCWMAGFSLDASAFRCDAESFSDQLSRKGVPGIGIGKYYLMPEGLTFLQEQAEREIYPFSTPPASRCHRYDATTCPTAHAFLESFIRWTSFCEKYEPGHCELVADIVRNVADANRV
ncbi:MAG: hypothetical protein HOH43_20100 [Candidatus Latescibacteria bacterium]|jgi:perosamine synthetase|nr:hypothetical protein [Candidatus Latescibacterota bacterium]